MKKYFRSRLEPDNLTAVFTTQDTTMLAAAWAVVYGVVTITSGPNIWNIPAYQTALMVPYSPPSWGIALLVFGISIFAGMFSGIRRFVVWGLLMCSFWNLFFAISFGKEWWDAVSDPAMPQGIGLGPVVTYGFICLVFAVRVSTYRRRNAVTKAA